MKWDTIKLGELALKKGGSVDPTKHRDEVFELYSIPAFDAGTPDILSGSQIGSAKKAVEPDDVMISRIVPHIRRACVVGRRNGHRQIASGEWIIFRNERIWPHYLRWVLVGDTFHSEFMRTVSGVGGSLLRARPAEVFKIEIPLPPLAEQKRIAGILDAADALRAKRREALAELDALLQAIFLDMFGDPVANPKGWEASPVDDLPLRIGDGNYSSKYPKSDEFIAEGVPFIRANNISHHTITGSDLRYISAKQHAELRKGHLERGDVLITTRGDIGQVALVPEEFVGANINAQLVFLRPTDAMIRSAFLCYLLAGPGMQRIIKSLQTGVALKQLPIRSLKRLSLLVPPQSLQERFCTLAESVNHQKSLQIAHLAELDTLFASLQSRAFRGEL